MHRQLLNNNFETTDGQTAGSQKQEHRPWGLFQANRQKLMDIGMVVFAWLIALALVYMVIIKISIMFK